MRTLSASVASGVLAVAVATAACGAAPAARPEVAVEARGTKYPPLPPRAPVTVYKRGREPGESYREIGKVTASCPEKHWVGGREERGLPVCLAGLKQGARMLGGTGVISVSIQRTRPDWDPEKPWLIMRGRVVRTLR